MKRGQISVEYLIVVGFIIFVVLSFLGVAVYYTANIRDRVRFNQLENFATKITSSAEEVFFAGEPSKVTVQAYLPSGVQDITIQDNRVVITITSDSGLNIIGYPSDVPIQGTLATGEGLRTVVITAQSNVVQITGS